MASDRDAAVVGVIKELMNESDFFLNLHDGSGFFSPVWESTLRNPMRFGQSIIADAEEHTRADGSVLNLGSMVERVLEKVNAQIPVAGASIPVQQPQDLDERHPSQGTAIVRDFSRFDTCRNTCVRYRNVKKYSGSPHASPLSNNGDQCFLGGTRNRRRKSEALPGRSEIEIPDSIHQ